MKQAISDALFAVVTTVDDVLNDIAATHPGVLLAGIAALMMLAASFE